MFRVMRASVASVAVLGAIGCATTTWQSSWRSPEAGPLNFKGKKVAALVISKEESVRYGAEDHLARAITAQGAVGMAAYGVVPKELIQDKEQAKAFLAKQGIVGVVAMRVVGKDQQLTQTGGGYWASPNYATFWGTGYYGWGWGGVYNTGYLKTDTIVSVETLVFSLEQDKLVWAGMSETTNPDKVASFIDELVKGVAAELRKQKLIR